MRYDPKIQFVFARPDSLYDVLPSGAPPIGLEIIASCLERKGLGKIGIYDCPRYNSNLEVVPFLDGDFVGFSIWFTNIRNSLEMARKVKKNNPNTTIVFGGPYASNCAEKLIEQHSFIDNVVKGDGEEAIVDLVKGDKVHGINNLICRRDDGKVEVNETKNVDLNSLPLFDLSHLTKDYPEQYPERGPGILYSVLPISLIRGCYKAVKLKKRCDYCAMSITGIRSMDPEKGMKQIKLLFEKYGQKRFHETGDDFFSMIDDKFYPELLLKAKPKGLDVSFDMVNIRPGSLTKKRVNILKGLGITEVFIGYETPNQKALAKATAGKYNRNIYKEFELLQDGGINITLSSVQPFPEETKQDLDNNFRETQKLYERFESSIDHITMHLPIPLRGSNYFGWCEGSDSIVKHYKDMTGGDLKEDAVIDYNTLTGLFIKQFAGVDLEYAIESIRKVEMLVGDKKIIPHWISLKEIERQFIH